VHKGLGHTDTRPQSQDALLSLQVRRLLQPFPAIVVRAQQAVALDVAVGRKLAKGALELLLGQVQSVVVNGLAAVLEGLEQEIDLAKVSAGLSDLSNH